MTNNPSKPLKQRISEYPAPARLGLFILVLLVFWLPLAIPIHFIFLDDPNKVSILAMGLLFIEFIVLLHYWSKYIHNNGQGLKQYGLVLSRKMGIELLNGLTIGLFFTLALFVIESWLGWLVWQPASAKLGQFIAEGLLTGFGVAFAEETFFRGWILDELERDYSPKIALISNALIFALLHFLKPLGEIIRTFPQFPALVILGLTLVWAKWSYSGRLGMSIGLHGGLVWGYYILNVGGLIAYTNQVPPWLTGIDGNPIAGGMGLFFLAILAALIRAKVPLRLQ